MQVLTTLKESCIALVDIMFALSINIIRIKRVSPKDRYVVVKFLFSILKHSYTQDRREFSWYER